MIHSELHGMVIEAGGYNDLQNYAANYQGDDPFMMIWEYYKEHGQYVADENPGWQHEYMADNYIKYIADGLNKFHPVLSSQAFIDYGNSISGYYGDLFSWDKLFYYMAWEGLHETTQFQTKIIDEGKNLIYGSYITLSQQEGSSNKCQ